MSLDRSRQLTLISDHGHLPPPPRPVPRSLPQLSHDIVEAARDWAGVAFSLPEVIDTRTEEGRLRMALLDAVHDMEYAEANLATRQADDVTRLTGEP